MVGTKQSHSDFRHHLWKKKKKKNEDVDKNKLLYRLFLFKKCDLSLPVALEALVCFPVCWTPWSFHQRYRLQHLLNWGWQASTMNDLRIYKWAFSNNTECRSDLTCQGTGTCYRRCAPQYYTLQPLCRWGCFSERLPRMNRYINLSKSVNGLYSWYAQYYVKWIDRE